MHSQWEWDHCQQGQKLALGEGLKKPHILYT